MSDSYCKAKFFDVKSKISNVQEADAAKLADFLEKNALKIFVNGSSIANIFYTLYPNQSNIFFGNAGCYVGSFVNECFLEFLTKPEDDNDQAKINALSSKLIKMLNAPGFMHPLRSTITEILNDKNGRAKFESEIHITVNKDESSIIFQEKLKLESIKLPDNNLLKPDSEAPPYLAEGKVQQTLFIDYADESILYSPEPDASVMIYHDKQAKDILEVPKVTILDRIAELFEQLKTFFNDYSSETLESSNPTTLTA